MVMYGPSVAASVATPEDAVGDVVEGSEVAGSVGIAVLTAVLVRDNAARAGAVIVTWLSTLAEVSPVLRDFMTRNNPAISKASTAKTTIKP